MEGNLQPINNASMLVPVLNDEEKSYVDQNRLECGDEELSVVQSAGTSQAIIPINATAPRLTAVARQSNPETDGSSETDDESRMDVFLQEEEPQLVVGAGSSTKKGGPQELTYPSLDVTARASLAYNTFPQAIMNAERQRMDNRMKRVLNVSPTVLTKYLLQQRLIKCKQTCTVHPGTKLKLRLCSDSAMFPYSRGYVWFADCCGGSFTVFKGSIFEISPDAPTVILKLLYHWSCQTSVAKTLHLAKVDNDFLNTFFMYLRAACVAAVHEKSDLMGGPGCKKIEVGVISLGTPTGAGAVKEVIVDILGAMDYENKKLRLQALDHLNMNDPSIKASDVYLKKFRRILETLRKWVNPNSVIVTDFAIDRNLCNMYGFKNMCQCNTSELNNSQVMKYLSFVVSRMFQNTLNLLSRNIIQQFLDELVWRESWGPTPSRAYHHIIKHLIEQTNLDGPEDMRVKYMLISSNPYKDWKYSNWAVNMSQENVLKKELPQPGSITNVGTNKEKSLSTSMSLPCPTTGTMAEPELANIALEPYNHGAIQCDPSRQSTGC